MIAGAPYERRPQIITGDWYGSSDAMRVVYCPACHQPVGRGFDHGEQKCVPADQPAGDCE